MTVNVNCCSGACLVDWNADRSSWVAGRVSDGELKSAGEALKKAAEKYGKDLGNAVKKDKSLDEAGKKGAADRIAAFTAAAKSFEELLKKGSDATAGLERVVSAAADLRSFTDGDAGAAPLAGAALRRYHQEGVRHRPLAVQPDLRRGARQALPRRL